MRILRGTTVAMLATVVALTSVEAQITVLPAGGGEPIQMPNSRQMKTGTGRIKGRLVTADTGAPVRRAQVRLSGSEVMPKTTTTDNDGTYEFRDLPAGRFTVNASKSGYVSVGYGQTRPFESPKPIELGDGQAIDRADIAMPRGSAIAGRIVDEFGEPVADVAVTAMRSTWSNGRRRLQATGRGATTNDLGQYRIYGLPPGEYFVSATLRGAQEMMVMEMAVAAVRFAGDQPSEAPRSGYAPTYYPGTPNGNEAQRVAVALGQEITSADFGLVPVRLARISGVVIGSDGRPVEGTMVSATPRTNAAGAVVFPAAGGTARTDANGNFTLNGIAPGEYTLNARGTIVMQSSGDGDRAAFTMTRVMTMGGGDGGSESGSVPISVTGEDLSNVVIATSKGTTVSGRVLYEGGEKPRTNTLRVSAASLDGENPLGMLGGSSSVTAEGTFEIKGVSGPRTIRVANVPAGWTVKEVRLNGADITDLGLDIRPSQPVSGIEVVLTNRITEVSGGVKAGNDPATDYTVVIFSEDPQKWIVPMPRHIASARPNQSGRFQVKGLPAGDYYAIAVDYIAQGDWNDPEVLERLRTRATRFSLGEGEVKTIELGLEGM